MTNATATKAQAANLNPIAMGLAQLVQANLALTPSIPTDVFHAAGHHNARKIVTDLSIKNVAGRFPDAEAMRAAGIDVVQEHAAGVHGKRVVSITEYEDHRSHFLIEFWELNGKDKLELVQRYSQVASAAAWAWVQAITDYLSNMPAVEIAFPEVVTQYLADNERSYKDVRGLQVASPVAMAKPAPSMIELFDPEERKPGANAYSRLFRVLSDQSFMTPKKWNELMNAFLDKESPDLRESIRAKLNERFVSADMSWEEFQTGVQFLQIEDGEDAVTAEDVEDARVCFFDNKLHVLAAHAA